MDIHVDQCDQIGKCRLFSDTSVGGFNITKVAQKFDFFTNSSGHPGADSTQKAVTELVRMNTNLSLNYCNFSLK
jgi:hypothetical protein